MAQRQTYDQHLGTYPRVVLVHLPRFPLAFQGDKPLYVLGEYGERLERLRLVAATGVARCQLVPVRVVPVWHLPQLKRHWLTAYQRGRKSAYLVDGPAEERMLADVVAQELVDERHATPAPPPRPRIDHSRDGATMDAEERELLAEMMATGRTVG